MRVIGLGIGQWFEGLKKSRAQRWIIESNALWQVSDIDLPFSRYGGRCGRLYDPIGIVNTK